ncbi:MAG: TetR/AcrR family transcriptional regulator [Ilumatobacteraceae bacterium]
MTRILDETIVVIETSGETAIRLAKIATRAGVTRQTLYRYFPSREDLIVAAHTERFRRTLGPSLDLVSSRVSSSASYPEFWASIRQGLEYTFSEERREARSVRVGLFSAALSETKLLNDLNDSAFATAVGMAEPISVAQGKGWLRDDVSALTIAVILRSLAFGRFLIEVDEDRYDGDEWNQLAVDAFGEHFRVDRDADPEVGAAPTFPPSEPEPKRSDTRSRLIDATNEVVTTRGEAAVRLVEIAAAVGVKQPSIYAFFESREDLLNHALRDRLSRTVMEAIDVFSLVTDRMTTRSDFTSAAASALMFILSDERSELRSARLGLYARALANPTLLTEVNDASWRSAAALTDVIAVAQRNDWIRRDVSALSIAMFIRSLAFGRFFVETDRQRYDGDEWTHQVVKMILRLILSRSPES